MNLLPTNLLLLESGYVAHFVGTPDAPVSAAEALALEISPDVFYHRTVREVYRAVLALAVDNEPITIDAVVEVARGDEFKVDEFEVYEVCEHAGSAGHRQARQLYQIARPRIAMDRIKKAVATMEPDAAVSAVRMAIQAADDLACPFESTDGDTDTAKAAIAAFSRVMDQTRAPLRIPAADQLNAFLAEAVAGALLVIGGTTGSGKSSLALFIAVSLKASGMRPAIISIEDPEAVWGARVVGHYAGVDLADIERRGGLPTSNEGAMIEASVKRMRDESMPLYDVSGSLELVRSKMTRSVRVQGSNLLVVDYAQLISRSDMPRASRAQVIAQSAHDLKTHAKKLGVPLILLSQLRRPDSSSKKWEPTIFDLKETGDLENMAEGIVLLWKNDDEQAFGKVGKLKSSSGRPRFAMFRNSGGAVNRLETIKTPQSGDDEAPAKASYPSWGG